MATRRPHACGQKKRSDAEKHAAQVALCWVHAYTRDPILSSSLSNRNSHMIRYLYLIRVLLIMTAMISASAQAEKLTIERMFAAPDLSGPSLRLPKISPDGRLVTYLQGKDTDNNRLDLWAYDVHAHQHRLLVDSSRLTPGERPLSAEEAARRERQRTSSLSGIVDYQFSS